MTGRERCASMTVEYSGAVLTRRSLLERAGWIIAAAAFPPALEMAAQSLPAIDTAQPGAVMAGLSAYMSEARSRPLPDEVIEKVKQHVLDTLAAMVSGSQLPPGRAALQFARSYGGEKVATVVASNVVCGPIEAALANGVLA